MKTESFLMHSRVQILHTILNVTEYPLFLPGCHRAKLIQHTETSLVVTLIVLHGFSFTTRMHWIDHQVFLENSFVSGEWNILEHTTGTKVLLNLKILPCGWMRHGLSALLPQYLPTMQRAFEDRLHALYPLPLINSIP